MQGKQPNRTGRPGFADTALCRPGYADDLREGDGREPVLTVRKVSIVPMGRQNKIEKEG